MLGELWPSQDRCTVINPAGSEEQTGVDNPDGVGIRTPAGGWRSSYACAAVELTVSPRPASKHFALRIHLRFKYVHENKWTSRNKTDLNNYERNKKLNYSVKL